MSKVHAENRDDVGRSARPLERDPAELVARIERLEEELDGLRSRYQRLRRSQFRRTALALALIAVSALAGAWAFPGSREVLIALGGIGLFAAVLIYYLTPERFIAAGIGAQVYQALATNEADIVTELGLQNTCIYLPVESAGADDDGPPVRLFVPKEPEYELPPSEALESRFVVTSNPAERGMTFVPSADGLVTEFQTTLSTGLGDTPDQLAVQLVDGLVNGFELVDAIAPTVSAGAGRARFAITGSAYGQVNRFDNPVASFIAVGLARGLETSVTAELTDVESDLADFLVTCEWKTGLGGWSEPERSR